MFKSSADLRKERTYKVLAFGPPGAGKTFFSLSFPQPVIIDFEHRADQQPESLDFTSYEPTSVRDAMKAIEQIGAGKPPCKTLVIDSASKPYQSLTRHYTTKGENGKESTDWAKVNRGMQDFFEPVFAIPRINVVSIARQVTRLERQGRDFKAAGVKYIGDEQRWKYDYDYLLHFCDRGVIAVEKSMSPHLPVGSTIDGDLDYARFVRIVTGEERITGSAAPRTQASAKQQTVAPAPNPVPSHQRDFEASRGTPDGLTPFITEARVRDIIAFAKGFNVNDEDFAGIISEVTLGRTTVPEELFPADYEQVRGIIRPAKQAVNA